MANAKTQRQRRYKSLIKKQVDENPEARLVKNRHRLLRVVILDQYLFFREVSKETAIEFLKDVTYIDRQIRKLTEGYDKENKKILSQKYQMEQLDYEPMYNQKLKV